MSLFYGDLYKPVSNIVRSGYHDGKSFKVSTKASPALKVTVDGARRGDATNGLFSWESNEVKNNVAYNLSGSLNLEGNVGVSAKAKNREGLTLGLSAALATDANSKDNKAKASLQYQQPNYTVETTVEKKVGDAVTVDASVTAKYDRVTVGAHASLLAYPTPVEKSKVLKNYNLGLRYSESNYQFAILAENQLKNVKIGYAQQVDPSLSLALNIDQDLSKPIRPVFTVGNTYKIDAESNVRAKIDNNGNLSAAYQVAVNKRLTATVSASTNVFDSSKGASTGVHFDFAA